MDSLSWGRCQLDGFVCDCCDEHYYTSCVAGYFGKDRSGKPTKILCEGCLDYEDCAHCDYCIKVVQEHR